MVPWFCLIGRLVDGWTRASAQRGKNTQVGAIAKLIKVIQCNFMVQWFCLISWLMVKINVKLCILIQHITQGHTCPTEWYSPTVIQQCACAEQFLIGWKLIFGYKVEWQQIHHTMEQFSTNLTLGDILFFKTLPPRYSRFLFQMLLASVGWSRLLWGGAPQTPFSTYILSETINYVYIIFHANRIISSATRHHSYFFSQY